MVRRTLPRRQRTDRQQEGTGTVGTRVPEDPTNGVSDNQAGENGQEDVSPNTYLDLHQYDQDDEANQVT
jgi:hypothetical protein